MVIERDTAVAKAMAALPVSIVSVGLVKVIAAWVVVVGKLLATGVSNA